MDGSALLLTWGHLLLYVCDSVFQEVMINVGDVGKDYEHGVQLLKKLSEFRGSEDKVSKLMLFQRELRETTAMLDCNDSYTRHRAQCLMTQPFDGNSEVGQGLYIPQTGRR